MSCQNSLANAESFRNNSNKMDRFDSVWCSSHWLWCGLWKKYLLKVESKPKGKLCESFEVRQKSHSLQCEAKPRLVMLSWTLLITLQPFKYFILAIYYFHSTGFAGHHHWVLSTVPVLVRTIKYSTNWPNAFSCTQGFPFSNGSPQWGGERSHWDSVLLVVTNA